MPFLPWSDAQCKCTASYNGMVQACQRARGAWGWSCEIAQPGSTCAGAANPTPATVPSTRRLNILG